MADNIYTKRLDGRKMDELRKMSAEVGVIPNADGSATFSFGSTVAIAAVYGPKPLHPQHLQNPKKGIIRCNYDLLSFSVTERKRPGPSRRSQEISRIIEWALEPVLGLDEFPGTVIDVHLMIIQADASTRCAAINAAAIALAHAGVPMKDLVSSVSIGKLDKQLVVDVSKEEEDYHEGEGATDIAMTFMSNSDKVLALQLDGKITPEGLKEAVKLGRKATKEVHNLQVKVLKEYLEKTGGGD
ncbi:exosome complex exonuclease Rrp41 [Candidatus Pacearchaeota archaeon CG10_big_fil_rev_8_21_14_0_10_35_13]|nr:MAG: exosome complex exonuclease Rrp41 [Candidatus Pacearchaeota archaeon CG10_big_fil_rev_8_21_14_0_10_35_13]